MDDSSFYTRITHDCKSEFDFLLTADASITPYPVRNFPI